MENLIYWRGKPVGTEEGGRIVWFSDTSPEVIAALNLQASMDQLTERKTDAT